MQTPSPYAPVNREEKIAELTASTGLNDEILETLVHQFYDRVRRDPMLGPIFEARITDWDSHLAKLSDFWSSVALMTGRYHGQPMAAHMNLPVQGAHFDQWLSLFRKTAWDVCPPAGAEHVISRAEKIADAIQGNIVDVRNNVGLGDTPPSLG